jgi:thiosulfate/3-mercaptopyruvate sulfurtransferase
LPEKGESTGDKKLGRRSMLKWIGALAAAAAGLAVVGWQLLSPIGSEEYANPEALVSSQWLEQHLQDSDIRVVELLSIADYNEGHIRGSVLVDWLHDITDPSYPDRYIVANKETIELLLGRIGVKEDTSIVLVDDLQNRLSMVMFWVLRYYGHEKVRILNGGRVAWEAAGKTYTDQITEVTQTKYTVKNVNENYRVRFDFISNNLNSPNLLLIDSRFSQQYTGEEPGIVYNTGKPVKRRGHIPGAINIPWNSNLRDDNTFKSHDELLQMFTDKGITKDKSIVTYCNEGIHAAANWFVLHELLGYPDVAVYNESMAEWANRDDVPVTLGANP